MRIMIRTENFVKNLTFLRKQYHLTYRALGHLIGIPPHEVEYIEKCRMYADLPTASLARLCTIFEVSEEDLIHTDLSSLPFTSRIKSTLGY